jgi:eukaryotic-like serine/threonine-protein kinase
MRVRRHTENREPLFESAAWRAFLRDMGLIAGTFVLGYGLSALWLSRGSVFSSEHALPRVLELPDAQARDRLTKLGFRPRLEGERTSDSFAQGIVIWQDPPPGTVLDPNSVVQLTVSSGPSLVAVPDVISLNVPQASKVLAAAGLRVGSVDTLPGGAERGVVLSTRPTSGVGRPRGAPVNLVISRGPESGR